VCCPIRRNPPTAKQFRGLLVSWLQALPSKFKPALLVSRSSKTFPGKSPMVRYLNSFFFHLLQREKPRSRDRQVVVTVRRETYNPGSCTRKPKISEGVGDWRAGNVSFTALLVEHSHRPGSIRTPTSTPLPQLPMHFRAAGVTVLFEWV
jgi:hypothetical protein